jgi:phospho-N-acetylmuramoyl-pentapeptide-transferase
MQGRQGKTMNNITILNVVKIFLPTALTFAIGILLSPKLTSYMYKYKLWKKKKRSEDSEITNEHFSKISNAEQEISTPRVGGIIIWLSVTIAIVLMWLISKTFPSDLSSKLDFLSRGQTLVPLASLLLGAAIGLVDDASQIRGAVDKIHHRYLKLATVAVLGAFIGAWFYFKLGMVGVAIPFVSHQLFLGSLFIPFFIIVLLAVFSGSVIDGMDGLAGGVLAIIFGAYSIIAFGKNLVDIAAFSAVISGAILAFLWFNIPPARFYMGETGILGLLVVLTVIAFLTDTVLLLPIIALPLAATTASNIIQITSYKYFGKRRVFKIAPLHHHFHALGWTREKVVMRYWVVSIVCAIIGVVTALISS